MAHDIQEAQDSVAILLKKADGDSDSRILDSFRLTGELDIRVFGPDGKLKDRRLVHNLVVTAGKGHIANLLQDRSSVNEMTRGAVGTGSTGPSAGDTDLQTEITTGLSGTRKTATRTNPSATSVLYATTWVAGEATNGAITEAGIFNASAVGPASGTMLARATFSAIAKASGDTLTINWTVTIT